MLDALKIENFKLFKQLTIPTLKRVNLIAGKNNVGKTALLEAIRIYYSGADGGVLKHIIESRGDVVDKRIIESYKSLFYKKEYDKFRIKINELEIFGEKDKFERFSGISSFHSEIYDIDDERDMIDYFEDTMEELFDSHNFIPAGSKIDNAKLWSNILLSKKEEMMTEMMQNIIPEIVRVSVKPDKNEPIVRLKDADLPVPLKNFGHGANRFFSIALAFVNSENKYLMIDEIENGLHHTVLEEIWLNVFKMAKKLEVQVFATTHSEACTSAFSYVMEREKLQNEGCYFRISKKAEGIFEPVYYNQKELELALSGNIEIR